MFLTRNKLIAMAKLMALFWLLPACSSGDKQADSAAEDNLAVNEDAGLEGGNQSDTAKKIPANNSANGSENKANENSNGNNADEQKTPISDDGYDDDWNNLNSQQQKANNNKNNKKNQIANEEPPLTDEGLGQQQQQQNAPVQEVAEQPVQQFVEQVPIEEPPLDLEPAPIAELPAPEPVPVPVVSAAPVVSGAPLIKKDTEPVFAQINWVGYDYLEKDSVVRIEIVTRGSPRYNLFQERNKSDQPELVLRFFNTQLRNKVRRDIDASEFRSPVAYVRMRADEVENSVDVIITLRDGVKPRMYSRFGNILLTFPIPDHYFGNAAIGSAPIAKAEVLANANIMPDLDKDSEIPEGLRIAKAFVNNPGKDVLGAVPNDAGEQVETETLPVSNGAAQNTEILPADFNTGVENPVQNVGNLNAGGNDVSGNNFTSNNNSANDQGGEEENVEENTNAGDNQENGEFSDFQGEPAQGAENIDFGGGQGQGAPAQGADNFSEAELNGDTSEGGGQQEGSGEELDEDSLDEFEDNGGGQEEIDKFDVRFRIPADPLALFAGFIVSQVSINAVAQDDFDEDFEQNQGNTQQGNGGNLDQGGNPELGNVAAQGNIDNSSLGGQNAGGTNGGNANGAGGNANTNANAGEGNFGNNAETGNGADDDFLSDGEAGGNNFGNTGADVIPANNGANVPNTTLNTGNAVNSSGSINALGTGNGVGGGNTSVVPEPAVEPVLEGGPDLAGPETEGSDTEDVAEPSSGGRKVKLDFRGAFLRDVIRVLSDESGVNFVYAPAVADTKIYLSLIDIPFNDALKALLSSHALGMVEIGPNIVKIDTLAAIALEKVNIETRRVAELFARPTKILVHRMSYARAEGVSALILPMLQAASSNDPRIQTRFDVRTNSVIINAVPEVLAVAKALLERIDMETPQVKIASRIVEIIKTAGDRMGVSWGTPFNFDQGRGLGFGNLVFPNYMLSRYTVDAGGTTPSAGNMQFRLGSMNNSMALDLALSMEEAKGTTEILQSNDLTVEDNTPATITAGRSDIIPTIGINGVPGSSTIDYNLTMTVTPHLTADGSVQMQLNISTVAPGPAASPRATAATNSKSIVTSLLRRSGETAVIGGVYNSDSVKSESGVPFFSKIPIIGALFRTKTSSEIKRELLIMVTPTVMPAIGKGFTSSDEPVSVSANASGNANVNSQLNNSENFNSNNQSDGDFDSNSNGNSNGNASNNASNNNNGQSNNNSNSGNNNQGNGQTNGNGNSQNQTNNQGDDDE